MLQIPVFCYIFDLQLFTIESTRASLKLAGEGDAYLQRWGRMNKMVPDRTKMKGELSLFNNSRWFNLRG